MIRSASHAYAPFILLCIGRCLSVDWIKNSGVFHICFIRAPQLLASKYLFILCSSKICTTGIRKTTEEYEIKDTANVLLCILNMPDVNISMLSDEDFDEVRFTVPSCVLTDFDSCCWIGGQIPTCTFFIKKIFVKKCMYYQTSVIIVISHLKC